MYNCPYFYVQAPDTVVSDLDPQYEVVRSDFVLDERYV